MPKATVHYVIVNDGGGGAYANFYADAKTAALGAELEEEKGEAFGDLGPHKRVLLWDDKGALTNPHATREELTRELSMKRGGDELGEEEGERATKKFNNVAAEPPRAFNVTLNYVVNNGGDGGASVSFYADKASAEIAGDIAQESGEGFSDQPKSVKLKFDAKGQLLNPAATATDLTAALAARRGEEAPAGYDLTGKTVVFTGTLTSMTRAEAEDRALERGATIGSGISKNTDILVVGADAGAKLAKAKELGVTVMTEAEWTGKGGTTRPASGFKP